MEAFSSPTIVHFVAALLLAASVVMPWQSLTSPAIVWTLAGFSGLAFLSVITYRMRKQTVYKPVFEDWLFHALLPLVAYAGLAASGLCFGSHAPGALFGVAGVNLLLLVIGIHNSWDNLTFLVTMRRQQAKVSNEHSQKHAG